MKRSVVTNLMLSVQDLLRVSGGVLRLPQQTGGAVHEATQRHDPFLDQIVSLLVRKVDPLVLQLLHHSR